MTTQTCEIILRDGRRVRIPKTSDNMLDIIPDGATLHVPLYMLDGADSWRRDMHEHFGHADRTQLVDAFGDDSAFVLSRTGARYLRTPSRGADHARQVTLDHLRNEARAAWIDAMQDAWRGTDNREAARKHNTGDPVADAWLDGVDDLTTSWSRNSRQEVMMAEPSLEQKIASALSSTDISATDVAELLRETATAMASADETAEQERAKALDPLLSPDPKAALAALQEVEFGRDRLRTLFPRLTGALPTGQAG